MGILIVHMFLTLDGVIQAPGAPDEDREGGFEHGGWQAPLLDERSNAVNLEQFETADALLLGRKTYEIFARYWPGAPPGDPFTKLMNDIPKYVASRTLTSADWARSIIIGDVPAEVPQIKKRHREVHMYGSSELIRTLLRHSLVDRMNLWLYPIVLGSGKRLFEEGTVPSAWRLVRSDTFSSGTVLLVLEPGGKPGYGDMAAEADPGR
jgi:dihydrofolate reductase